MKLYERVTLLTETLVGSKADLAVRIGLHPGTFRAYLNEKRQEHLWELLPQILCELPQVSREWLYFEEGEMLASDNAPLLGEDEHSLVALLRQQKEALAQRVCDLEEVIRAQKESLALYRQRNVCAVNGAQGSSNEPKFRHVIPSDGLG